MSSIYDPATYPKGVPNPYGPRVHAWNDYPGAYGTRYHGAVWTRPMQSFPWQQRPFAGLGAVNMQQVNTRNGIFANEGYGGGLFNLNVGFGGLGAYGRSNENAPSGLGRALGQVDIPQQCWSDPDFNSCYAFCEEQATIQCDDPNVEGGFSSRSECLRKLTEECGFYDCVGRYCPQAPLPDVPYVVNPWNAYSAQTAALQAEINVELEKEGYCPIEADGYLGPATCGAAQEVLHLRVPHTCREFTAPGECPAEGPPGLPPPAPPCPAGTHRDPNTGECTAFAPPEPTTKKMSMAWMAIGGLALAAVAGGVAYAMKDKTKT